MWVIINILDVCWMNERKVINGKCWVSRIDNNCYLSLEEEERKYGFFENIS